MVLVDTMAPLDAGRTPAVDVTQDWTTGLVGVQVAGVWNLPGVFLATKRRQREEYEQIRVLYVAMTRPRTQLVISCGQSSRPNRKSLFSLLNDATAGQLADTTAKEVPCGAGAILVEPATVGSEAGNNGTNHDSSGPDTTNWAEYEKAWRRRRARHDELRHLPMFLTPTGLKLEDTTAPEMSWPHHPQSPGRDAALALGEITHRILENWNFQSENRVRGPRSGTVAAHGERTERTPGPHRGRESSHMEPIHDLRRIPGDRARADSGTRDAPSSCPGETRSWKASSTWCTSSTDSYT